LDPKFKQEDVCELKGDCKWTECMGTKQPPGCT